MNTYISLLRGINVGGNNKILMKDLKDLYFSLGFEEIVSYIQSGNVIFKSKKNKEKVQQEIENAILIRFNLTIRVLIETPQTLKESITKCHFLSDAAFDTSKIYFSFLSDAPQDLNKLTNSNYGDAIFSNYKNIIYLYYPNGAGKAKLTNNFLEKKLNLTATSRNFKTLVKLIELSSLYT